MLYVKRAEVTAWFSQLKEKSTLVSVMTMAMKVSMKLAGVLNTSQTHNKLCSVLFSKASSHFMLPLVWSWPPQGNHLDFGNFGTFILQRIYIISLLVWISCTCVLTTDMALNFVFKMNYQSNVVVSGKKENFIYLYDSHGMKHKHNMQQNNSTQCGRTWQVLTRYCRSKDQKK